MSSLLTPSCPGNGAAFIIGDRLYPCSVVQPCPNYYFCFTANVITLATLSYCCPVPHDNTLRTTAESEFVLRSSPKTTFHMENLAGRNIRFQESPTTPASINLQHINSLQKMVDLLRPTNPPQINVLPSTVVPLFPSNQFEQNSLNNIMYAGMQDITTPSSPYLQQLVLPTISNKPSANGYFSSWSPTLPSYLQPYNADAKSLSLSQNMFSTVSPVVSTAALRPAESVQAVESVQGNRSLQLRIVPVKNLRVVDNTSDDYLWRMNRTVYEYELSAKSWNSSGERDVNNASSTTLTTTTPQPTTQKFVILPTSSLNIVLPTYYGNGSNCLQLFNSQCLAIALLWLQLMFGRTLA